MQRIVGNEKFSRVQIGDPGLHTLTTHVDLLAECRRCGHMKIMPTSAIESSRLRYKTLSVIARHMRCTACGKRDCSLSAGVVVPVEATATISEYAGAQARPAADP